MKMYYCLVPAASHMKTMPWLLQSFENKEIEVHFLLKAYQLSPKHTLHTNDKCRSFFDSEIVSRKFWQKTFAEDCRETNTRLFGWAHFFCFPKTHTHKTYTQNSFILFHHQQESWILSRACSDARIKTRRSSPAKWATRRRRAADHDAHEQMIYAAAPTAPAAWVAAWAVAAATQALGG